MSFKLSFPNHLFKNKRSPFVDTLGPRKTKLFVEHQNWKNVINTLFFVIPFRLSHMWLVWFTPSKEMAYLPAQPF